MRSLVLFSGLAALAAAAPRPQDIDFAGVDAAPDPTYTITPGLSAQQPTVVPEALIESVAIQVSETPLPQAQEKRGADKVRRGACPAEPTVANTYKLNSLADPAAFVADTTISSIAAAVTAPAGYVSTFVNKKGSSQAYGYMGYYLMDTYNTDACAAKCKQAKGCLSFNIFFERDPTTTPNDANCPNPPAFPAVKCTLWAGPVEESTATNTGQWRSKFQVVIAGSNGYTIGAPKTVTGYTGPDSLNNAAINAPLDCNGDDTYMGYLLFTDGVFDVAKCAAGCTATSESNLANPPANGKPKLCKFFNTYILFKNNQPQGQYCSMYTQVWDSSYAKNTGQWRGTDQYTIGYSFSYRNTTDSGLPVCPSDISYLKDNGQEFCTSFNKYQAPVTTTSTTTTPALATTTKGVVITESSTATVTTTSTNLVQKREDAGSVTPLVPLRAGATTGQLSPAVTSPTAAFNRRAVATPASITGWASSKISEACSKVATGTLTSTSIITDPTPYTTAFSTSTTTTSTTQTVTTTTTIHTGLPAKFAISGIPGVNKAYIAAGYPLVYSTDKAQGVIFDIDSEGFFFADGRLSNQNRGQAFSQIFLDPRSSIGPGAYYAAVLAAVQSDGTIRLTNTETQSSIVQICSDSWVYLGNYLSAGCTKVQLSIEH